MGGWVYFVWMECVDFVDGVRRRVVVTNDFFLKFFGRGDCKNGAKDKSLERAPGVKRGWKQMRERRRRFKNNRRTPISR